MKDSINLKANSMVSSQSQTMNLVKPDVKRTIICIGQKNEQEVSTCCTLVNKSNEGKKILPIVSLFNKSNEEKKTTSLPTITLVNKSNKQTLNKKVFNLKNFNENVNPIQNFKSEEIALAKPTNEAFNNFLDDKNRNENNELITEETLIVNSSTSQISRNEKNNYYPCYVPILPSPEEHTKCTSSGNGIEVIANYIVGTENIIIIKNENMETISEKIMPSYDLANEFTIPQSDVKPLEDPDELEPWLGEEASQIPDKCKHPQHFIVDTIEDFKKILREYEHDSLSCFQNYGVKGKFYTDVTSYDGGAIHFKESGGKVHLFKGAPFTILGKIILKCHQGIYYRNYNKWRYKSDGEERKKYRKRIMSKKMNCPVRFVVTKVLVFPDYHVDPNKDSKREATRLAKFIREQKHDINGYVKYVFTLPSVLDHKYHKLGMESISREAVDKRIIVKMEEYIKSGIIKAPTIKTLLKSFIQHELKIEKSQWERRKYNPSLKDIRGKINRTLNDIKQSKNGNSKLNTTLIKISNKENKKDNEKMKSKKRKVVNSSYTYEQNIPIQTEFGSIQGSGLGVNNNIRLNNLNSHSFQKCDKNYERKSLQDHISQLELLGNTLKGEELSALENDIINLVSKWTSQISVDQLELAKTSNISVKKKKKISIIETSDHSY